MTPPLVKMFRTLPLFALLAALVLLLANPSRIDAGPQAEPPRRSLSELEGRLINPDEVLIASADLEAGQAQMAQLSQEQGWKLFAGAGTGLTEDTKFSGSDRRYTTYDLRAGLRYPLLGRGDAEKRGVIEAETSVLEKEQRLQLARRQSLTLLRQSYLSYWAAQEKLRISQTFLASEAKQYALLTDRRQAGYLLESDRLEFLSAYELGRRNQENLRAIQRSALNTIGRLTSTSAAFIAQAPLLALTDPDLGNLAKQAMEHYPSVVLLRQRLQGLERQVPLTRHTGTGAHFDVYTSAGVDDTGLDPEYSVGVNLSVEIPLGIVGRSGNAAQQSAQALVNKGRRELQLESKNVRDRVEELLGVYQASQADISFSAQRLRAAAAAARQNQQRTALEGDTLEKLQQSRFAYYQVAMDAADAQTRLWGHLITLLEYTAPSHCMMGDKRTAPANSLVDTIDLKLLGESRVSANSTTSLQIAPLHEAPVAKSTPKPTAASVRIAPLSQPVETAAKDAIRIAPLQAVVQAAPVTFNPGDTAFYVWDADRFRFQTENDPECVTRLLTAGVRRVLLSLNQEQIDALTDPAARSAFARWLRQLREQALVVELLLGEPLWILPEHRPKLLSLIATLADLPFAGLHLDLEPDQLSLEQRGNETIWEWLATVEAAKKTCLWPVGVSVHPRYLQAQQGSRDLGTALGRLGVAEVVVMVYVSNPDRVGQVMTPILRQWPKLRFAVAQSVEPELPPEESHHLAGRSQFTTRMARLSGLLAAPNFNGLVVQDWTRWQEMQP